MNNYDAALLILILLASFLFTLIMTPKAKMPDVFGLKFKLKPADPDTKAFISKLHTLPLDDRILIARHLIGSDAVIMLHADESDRIGILSIGLNAPGMGQNE